MIYEIKEQAITEHRIGVLEERMSAIEDKLDLLITQLKIEFYEGNDGKSRRHNTYKSIQDV
jgi:hypothetical protein